MIWGFRPKAQPIIPTIPPKFIPTPSHQTAVTLLQDCVRPESPLWESGELYDRILDYLNVVELRRAGEIR